MSTLNESVARKQEVGIATSANEYVFAFGDNLVTTNNSAFGAVSAKVPTTTEPDIDVANGRGVVEVAGATLVDILFFGSDADGETGAFRVWGWHPLVVGGEVVWIPKLLLSGGTLTLSAQAATAIVANGFMADTVAATVDLTASSGGAIVKSPAGTVDNAAGSIALDPQGAAFLEIEMTRNSLTAASLGALVRRY